MKLNWISVEYKYLRYLSQKNKDNIKKYASYHFNQKDLFFLGRGLDFAVALEGSLKLKEISYIHSEAYAGGELKHGPIALIEKGTSVITLLTQERLKDKMLSNVKEVTVESLQIGMTCIFLLSWTLLNFN